MMRHHPKKHPRAPARNRWALREWKRQRRKRKLAILQAETDAAFREAKP